MLQLRTSQIYYLTALEVKFSNRGISGATFLLESLGEEGLLAFPVSGGLAASLGWRGGVFLNLQRQTPLSGNSPRLFGVLPGTDAYLERRLVVL